MDWFPVKANDGFLFKLQMPGTNYCQLKFPALREDTLSWSRPLLKDPTTSDIIDFYGSCEYDPTGKAAVQTQKLDWQRRFSRQYAD